MSTIKKRFHRQRGFALLEVALAIVIVASIFITTTAFLTMNQHRTSAERIGNEINEIFNAGISYYLTHNNTWPDKMDELVAAKLLPAKSVKNPWGYDYSVDRSDTTTWTLGTCLPQAVADNLAALLPFGAIADSTYAKCQTTESDIKYVTTKINQTIDPKHNLVAQMIKDGQKVAAPACPQIGDISYAPKIYLLPASFDSGGHPISGMSAYADPINYSDPKEFPNGYWTAHLALTTDQGTQEDDGQHNSNIAVIMAFIDCEPGT